MSYEIRKILVIYKKSSLELAEAYGNERLIELIEKGDPSVANWQKAHDENAATIKVLQEHLWQGPFHEVTFRTRDEVKSAKNYHLIITVGGDGTFLWGSKFAERGVPILGINSDPSSSVGFYTVGTKEDIPALVKELAKPMDRVPGKVVQRLQVAVNGKIEQTRVLNDVLFAAEHPASMTNYNLFVHDNDGNPIEEEQRSSGIWISTACGSTGANLSAGGWILKMDDERAQYVVREPMKNLVWGTEHRYVHGFFTKNSGLKIVNKTRKALLACDGTTDCISVTTGDQIEISQSEETLFIYGK